MILKGMTGKEDFVSPSLPGRCTPRCRGRKKIEQHVISIVQGYAERKLLIANRLSWQLRNTGIA
jgi:hypothetical protein